jgi:hypothetical protein
MPTSTYWEQPERVETKSDGAKSITKTFKGDFGDLAAYAGGLVVGTTTESAVVVGTGETVTLPLRAINITRTVGKPNLATLRLEYGKETTYSSEKTATETSVNWSVKHTQRIVSLMRRTGESASMPHRGNLEAWRKEPDPSLYDSFQYRNQVGAVMTLSLPEQAVAAKLKAGIEGAMRFYPTIQKVTVYTGGKITNVGAGLARISAPGSPWDDIKIGGETAAWLKVGDDVSVDGKAGTQTRTESWIGAKSWDADLYGENAWPELDEG